jgi:hypothetical protein
MQRRIPFRRLKEKIVKRWKSSPLPSSVKHSEHMNRKADCMCWTNEYGWLSEKKREKMAKLSTKLYKKKFLELKKKIRYLHTGTINFKKY